MSSMKTNRVRAFREGQLAKQRKQLAVIAEAGVPVEPVQLAKILGVRLGSDEADCLEFMEDVGRSVMVESDGEMRALCPGHPNRHEGQPRARRGALGRRLSSKGGGQTAPPQLSRGPDHRAAPRGGHP